MKKLVLFPFTIMLITTPVLGYKQEDLDKLWATNKGAPFDLRGADLSGAKLPKAKLRDSNLTGVNLTGAVLLNAKIDFADFSNAKLCNTIMPNGQRIFKDC